MSPLMSKGPAQPDSGLDPTDPYARKAQTFPRLSEEMAARIVAYGTQERLPKGTLVFARGERSVDFFFVFQGDIEIFDFDEDGQPNVLHVHGERNSPASSTCSTTARSWFPGVPARTAGCSG